MDSNSGKKLHDIGERSFLKSISHLIDSSFLDFNDDASAIELPSGEILVLNLDMLVKKTDILPKTIPEQIGKKAVTMSVSDIIAKGIKPIGCLSSIGFPSDFSIDSARKIINGIKSQCVSYDCLLLGGDLNQSCDIIIDVASFGLSKKEQIISRKNLKDGYLLFSSGYFGFTSLGFKAVLDGLKIPPDLNKYVLTSVYEPIARIDYLNLFKEINIESCMDSSDGLYMTLTDLCSINDIGINVENVPLHPKIVKFAEKSSLNPLDLAFNGGEEFELIFAIKPEEEKNLIRRAKNYNLEPIYIGHSDSKIDTIEITDKCFSGYSLKKTGYNHFV